MGSVSKVAGFAALLLTALYIYIFFSIDIHTRIFCRATTRSRFCLVSGTWSLPRSQKLARAGALPGSAKAADALRLGTASIADDDCNVGLRV